MKQLIAAILLAIASFSMTNKMEQDDFIVRPYLQLGANPTTTSLDLMWHTADTDADWSVEVKASDKGSWQKMQAPTMKKVTVVGIAPRRIYATTLTNLVSGTLFNYRVLKAKKVVFESNGKASKTADQAYRFVAIGDIGAGSANQKSAATQIFNSNPDFVAITGDIVYERGLASEYDTRFWPIYNSNKIDSGFPMMKSTLFVGAPGNHDTDTRDLDKYPDALSYYYFWNQPLNGPVGKEGSAGLPVVAGNETNKQAFLMAAGKNFPSMTNFSFDYGNAHWTIVDSNPYMDWTDSTLVKWVADDLAKAKDATWRFVMYHHPGFNSAREHYEQQHMRLLSPIFEKGNVDIVFNGHVHNYQRTYPIRFKKDKNGTLLMGGKDNKSVRGRVVNGAWKLDKSFDGKINTTPQGIIYIVTGAGGQELYNPEQNDDPDTWQKFTDKFKSTEHSFTVADVDGKTLVVRQISADGKELDSFKIVKR
jgi:acid phosphatase type 7